LEASCESKLGIDSQKAGWHAAKRGKGQSAGGAEASGAHKELRPKIKKAGGVFEYESRKPGMQGGNGIF